MDQEKEKQKSDADISAAAKAESYSNSKAPDANVDAAGHCVLTQDGEMARPDSGEPCDEGTGG